MKKAGLFLFIYVIASIFLVATILAQEETLSELNQEFEDAELQETEGITPDSALYFVDDFFDQFSDDVKIREEKVAEIRAMIEGGNFEAAREALERYRKYADSLERDVSPEQRDEARRSAAAIYNVLKSLEAQIPDENKEEFFDDILERESRIVTAAEIASKIKELCEQLSKLDPLEYERVCKTDDDAPEWHKKLDRDLTEEQQKEAEEFFEIMLQCFETSGGECRCDDISITAFAEKCSIIAPLAYACEVEDNEEACEKMDDIEEEEPIEDLLPDYLKDVLLRLEDRYSDAQFDNHAPRECREAGATTRQECMNIMFRLNAPPECVEALENGEISLDNEREARESCERIMFELEAPRECKDAGLTDFRECGKLMFQLNAPQECIDAGLTGEYESDARKCRELVEGKYGHGGERPVYNINCAGITNSEERLACYDSAVLGAQNFDDRFRETQELQRQCAERCLSQGGAWSFSNGNCECRFPEFEEEFSSSGSGSEEEQRCFSEGGNWRCSDVSGCYCEFSSETGNLGGETTESTTTTDSSTASTGSESTVETTSDGITGNAFLEYYFR